MIRLSNPVRGLNKTSYNYTQHTTSITASMQLYSYPKDTYEFTESFNIITVIHATECAWNFYADVKNFLFCSMKNANENIRTCIHSDISLIAPGAARVSSSDSEIQSLIFDYLYASYTSRTYYGVQHLGIKRIPEHTINVKCKDLLQFAIADNGG